MSDKKQDLTKIIEALNHVKSVHPEVTIVIFTNDGTWLYLNDDLSIPVFDLNTINTSVLEAAADSVPYLPFIHQIYNN